ncbi:SPOSA6832_03008 [Sporobolomyces salmonicolor]|uniref:SPOSA6832_03008-mRNA-1:cds n=1 Tax=Sporidiobolus salmonicolor TaxID=5005 RepID=A0A0D6EMM8_SPOSA|nr:SPOSA6832_03008 [Sporobolomyces salmonicolor]
MQPQRDHLNRDAGDVEVGVADLYRDNTQVRHSAPLPSPPSWLVSWERHRPPMLAECFAEMLGVFFYVFSGIGASAAFLVTTAAKESGYGSLLTIAIAFWLFKGFPARKVPFYIVSQIFGGFLAAVFVYGIYKQQLDEVVLGMNLLGEAKAIYSPQAAGQNLGWAFFVDGSQNEFIANVFLSILVFSVLDACNFFVSLASAPFIIGMGYAVIIWGFSPNSVSLNAARDLGGRFACGAFYGRQCFNTSSGYTAIAALTTIPASLIGAAIQTLLLSDSARMIVNAPPSHAEQVSIINESRGFTVPSRSVTRDTVYRDPMSMKTDHSA